MRDDLVKSIRLIRFSMSKRTNAVMMVLFFILGLGLEIMESTIGMLNQSTFPIGIGSIFLICTAMFPSQMLVSVDVSTIAQSSAYKRKLQTSMPVMLLLISSLLAFTLIIAIRCAGIALRPGRSMEELNILPAALFAAFIVLYSGVVYKFFVLSVIVLWLTMTLCGGVYGYLFAKDTQFTFFQAVAASPAWSIVLSYLLILAATGLEYLISVALYRFPLSKYALRCSRNMN